MTTDLSLLPLDLSNVPDRIDLWNVPANTIEQLYLALERADRNPREGHGRYGYPKVTANCPQCGKGNEKFSATLQDINGRLKLQFRCFSCENTPDENRELLLEILRLLEGGQPRSTAPNTFPHGDSDDEPKTLVASYEYRSWQHGVGLLKQRYVYANGTKTFRISYPDGERAFTDIPALFRCERWCRVPTGGTSAAPPSLWIVEGERDVLTLEGLGLVATTCCHGAGTWREEHSQLVRAAVAERAIGTILVVPDLDLPGLAHAAKVLASLRSMGVIAHEVRLPGEIVEGHGRDVSDWIEAGATLVNLLELAVGSLS